MLNVLNSFLRRLQIVILRTASRAIRRPLAEFHIVRLHGNETETVPARVLLVWLRRQFVSGIHDPFRGGVEDEIVRRLRRFLADFRRRGGTTRERAHTGSVVSQLGAGDVRAAAAR